MQKFENGSTVKVVSLDTTRRVCGISTRLSMDIGDVLTIDSWVPSDNAYLMTSGAWYAGDDLEQLDQTSEFEINCEVEVVSLDKTKQQFKLDTDTKSIHEVFTVFDVDQDDESVCDYDGNWYAMVDVEVVETAPRKYLSIDDVSVGDTMLLVSVDRTDVTYGLPDGIEVGDTFVIRDIDRGDDSIYTGEDWIYLTDLDAADPALVDEDDEDDEDAPVPTPTEPEVTFLITRDSVTLSIDGDTEVATADHVNFDTIRQFVHEGDYTSAMAMMNVAIGITSWGQGALQIQNGQVVYAGMELTGKLVDRIVEQMVNGDTAFERFAKFLNLTMNQESFKTRERLMDFAAHDKLDINEDGYVVAFKNVRDDFMDKHSGTFDNNVGESPSIPRHMVNDDHNTTCAAGLHVCSPEYLKGFWGTSGKTLRVVVDPRDFVAIPYDYNDSKARVCKYTVVEDVTDKINDYF